MPVLPARHLREELARTAHAAPPAQQRPEVGMGAEPRSRRPRVLHVISHLDLGGAEEVAITLAEQLAGDHELHFFAVLGQKDSDVGRDFARRLGRLAVPVYFGTALPFKRGGLLQAAGRLRSVLARLEPELIHLHTEVPEATYALATAWPRGRGKAPWRVLRSVHNSVLWPAWSRIGRQVERRLSGARVAGVSQACLNGLWHFQRRQGLQLTPENRCQVIYNGVWRGPPAEGAEEDPQHLPLMTVPGVSMAPDALRVLFAGRFEYQKGADLVPRIVEAAAAQLPGVPVDVALLGSGSLEAPLRQWAATQSTGWSVRIEPPLARLAEHLHHFDVLLVPSRFEGLSLLAVEALLAGVPLVACRAEGLSEVLEPDYPFACPVEVVECLAARLSEVLRDPAASRRQMQAYVAPARRRFSVAEMAERYRVAYREQLAASHLTPQERP